MNTYFIGLMSGTSLDAADAALVECAPEGTTKIRATHALGLAAGLREELLSLSKPDTSITPARLGALDQRLGDWFADAALAVMAQANVTAKDIAAVGSHGQTLWHEPGTALPFSLQLGSASRIAARTRCVVVADFRNSDMAIGGQGAPLAPAFHRSQFAVADKARIVVNIGGMANLTILPKGADRDDSLVTGFDTGPGNALMDGWIHAHLGHAMDTDGQWAAGGRVHAPLLERMLREPYLNQPAPKSTGREYFNMNWLQARMNDFEVRPADVQATLCEYTARTVAMAIETYGPGDEEILVCGGGAHNPQLMARLASLLAPRPVATTGAYGMDVDWVEAAAFAWLAMRRINGLPGNLPSVTGARKPTVLGGIYRS